MSPRPRCDQAEADERIRRDLARAGAAVDRHGPAAVAAHRQHFAPRIVTAAHGLAPDDLAALTIAERHDLLYLLGKLRNRRPRAPQSSVNTDVLPRAEPSGRGSW